MKYLGIDLGTSSLKASIADEKGNILLSSSRSYPLLMPKENYTEQNPEDWYNALIEVLKDISSKCDLSDLKAMSFCGQMHGLVLLDKDDNVIRPAILWNDSRTTEEVDYLNNVIGKEKLIEETSNIAICGFTLPKILWVKKHEPENFKKIKKIMLPKDYLVYKITKKFVSDITDLSGTLFFDVKNRKYSKFLLDIASINEEMLPEIHDSFDFIGYISEDFVKISNLNKNVKVVVGGGDQAVGATGTNTLEDNSLFMSLGTSGTVFASSSTYKVDKEGRVHSFRHTNGKYHLMGCTLCASLSLKWWLEDILETKDYDKELGNLPEEISDIIFLPYLMGERSPINDPNAKGMFSSLNAIYKRRDLTKAVVEGISFSLFDNLRVMEDLGLKFKEARVIGGAAKSSSFLKILADITGLKLKTINTTDGGSLGAIILAMVGDGLYKTLSEASNDLVKDIKVYEPNLVNHEKYLLKFKKYKNLYESNFFHK